MNVAPTPAVGVQGIRGSLLRESDLWALAVAAVTLLALVLRLADIRPVPLNPYYDAAVRSMGRSWHNFLYGAFNPGGRVAIDKPPVDLWLQVAAVKLFGFKPIALKLPAALAASLATPLLYDALRRSFAPAQRLGRAAGLLAALALALTPISVLTSRSDTMDSLMMALLVLAAWLIVRYRETDTRRPGFLLLAALALGLAFNVKLLEILVALPALALLASWHAPRRHLALAAAILAVSALSWITIISLTPRHDRPYLLGSSNGSVWNAVFVFNGLDRIAQPAHPGVGLGEAAVRSPSGPLRLFDYNGLDYGGLIGTLLLGALLFGGLALWLRRPLLLAREAPDRPRSLTRAGSGIATLALWLLTGYLLFSFAGRLHPRYLEAFTPAVAATLGVGLAVCGHAVVAVRLPWRAQGGGESARGVGEGEGRRRLVAALTLVAALAVFALPLVRDLRLIRAHASDEALAPSFTAPLVTRVTAFLRAHQHGARYEFAASAPTLAAPIIVRDVRPMLLLAGVNARPLLTLPELQGDVADGELRYVLSRGRCPLRRNPRLSACSPLIAWVKAHGRDVTAQLHYPHLRSGLIYEITPPVT